MYDLTLEGVGIVANYRTQFNELLANGSYEKLIEKLKSKQGEGDIIAPLQQPKKTVEALRRNASTDQLL